MGPACLDISDLVLIEEYADRGYVTGVPGLTMGELKWRSSKLDYACFITAASLNKSIWLNKSFQVSSPAAD